MPHKNKERAREVARERLKNHGDRIRAKTAEWREKNRDYLRAKNTNRRLNKRAMCLVAAARIRAKHKGVPFTLDSSDVEYLQSQIDQGICILSGVSLTLFGPRSATSPSLDRIIPSLGYVTGNVRIICHALNAGMGDWGENELYRIVELWTRSIVDNPR